MRRSPRIVLAPTGSKLRQRSPLVLPSAKRIRKMPDTAALPPVTRGFAFTPGSVNETERTVELVASTGVGVMRRDLDGEFTEVLSLAPGAVDLSRADGMPLLDSHRQDGLDRVLGVVRSAKVDGGQLVVTAQFSERPAADAVFKDVKAGIVRNASIGYAAEDFSDRIDSGAVTRTRTVTKWTLLEVSLVPVGADAGAKTRGQNMPEPTPTNPAAV